MERTPRSSVVEKKKKKRERKFMPLIKKVAWPRRDVAPFESPRERASCAPCVRRRGRVYSLWSWVFFFREEGMADRVGEML